MDVQVGSIVVVTKGDNVTARRYSANHLSVMWRDRVPVLSFSCSGVLTIVPCADIDHIEFGNHRTFCSECDKPLTGSFG